MPSRGSLKPEDDARVAIDRLLDVCGWRLQDPHGVNLVAARGVAVRHVRLKHGHGEADYLLFVDGQAVGVVEAKPAGTTLTGVEVQSDKYARGLPDGIPAPVRPLPFCYQSTGVETRFTNGLDPDPRSRSVFAFHRPEMLGEWLSAGGDQAAPRQVAGMMRAAHGPAPYAAPATLLSRMRNMPLLITTGLWPAQIRAITKLECSVRDNRPRSLIQMSGGSGKTFMAVYAIYRMIKFAEARRVLFLVDRAHLARQTLKEFQQFVTPDDGRKFTELYNVQHLKSNHIDPVSRVCIGTIQRLYSILKGEDLDPAAEEASSFDTGAPLLREPVPVVYDAALPIEFFDVVFTDECHRSIYNLWRQVLEYFDGYIVGLTATPSAQTYGFFHNNLVMEYSHEEAVADEVNVDFVVYNIRTKITEAGSKIDTGFWVDKRDRLTRRVRWEQLKEDFEYDASDLDRFVVTPDQIRTIIRAFRDHALPEIFPGRREVPKTLVFAKDDSHADDIVQIVREEFGKGNDFAEKITYRTTGVDPETLISAFRNSYNPRIAVTVDMIATGTDIKPLEILLFMRGVRSRNYFEQMKFRGVRVIPDTELQAVTPDAKSKTHFVIVDAVGAFERELSDARPIDRQPSVPFDRLVQAVALNNRTPEVVSSLGARLARLDRRLDEAQRDELAALAGGQSLRSIAAGIIRALDPDAHEDAARKATGMEQPPPDAIERARQQMIQAAVAPIATSPALRNRVLEIHSSFEQTIDVISQDQLIEAGLSEAAREKARNLVESFESFLREHKDEIAALQVLYSRPYRQRLTFRQIKELAEAIKRPPRGLTPEVLWWAYETLDRSRVRGSGVRVLTDVVSLVRFALRQDDRLAPFPETVRERFAAWLAGQEAGGRKFTGEQRQWLELIRDHIATSFQMEAEDFDLAPFSQRGGLGRAAQVFGDELGRILDELNGELAA
ncbi:MAG: DEAD/DEAH box helicase family protein [Planctomycetes bacterium]|nr:DEAD/DEAH box helicase family protein [Planctomycetota bacterium]